MTLTKAEAENILTRVFSGELAGNSVEIIDLTTPPTVPGITIQRSTLDRVLKSMTVANLKIEAIKFYREAIPGTGLAEAKDFVERL